MKHFTFVKEIVYFFWKKKEARGTTRIRNRKWRTSPSHHFLSRVSISLIIVKILGRDHSCVFLCNFSEFHLIPFSAFFEDFQSVSKLTHVSLRVFLIVFFCFFFLYQ